jgi:glycolate oxidase FAD binding subunit
MSTMAELRRLTGVDVRPGESTSQRVHGVVPAMVVAPESAQAAAAVLRLASELGWRVELAGRGTLGDSGRPSTDVDVLLTTERLREVPEYAPADLTVTAGAGVTLGELDARLAPNGQFLPLDPPGAAGASLGAVLARADSGPLRLGYGTPRDHVLGLQLVTGDGRILELGGRVMKNVAGYDLVRLVVGSRGTLGLITRATVRLRPLPRADATVALRAPGPDACAAAALRLRQERLDAVAMEILSPEASAHVAAAGAWMLLVRLQGAARAVEDMAAAAHALGEEEGLAGERLEPVAAATAWQALSQLEALAPVSIRLGDRCSELRRTLALAGSLADAGGGWARVAHAGDGIVRVLPVAGSQDGWEAALEPAVEAARQAMAATGGSVIIARGPAALLARVDPFGPVPALSLMRGIRKTFDPAGVLAPGRFEI